ITMRPAPDAGSRVLSREVVIKAIVQHRYGSPDVLELKDIDKRAARENEVLVRVRAAAVNIADWHLLRGIPYAMRPAVGLLKPKHEIPGLDLAGEVEAVGGAVEQFQPGDEVFGWCDGAFAEYACAEENRLLAKPGNLTLEQAAAVGDSAFTALNAVRDQGRIRPGQKVVINGASGGVGTFAVQIAKSFGADVTGVCSTRNVDMVRSIGADQVIDYTQEDFTRAEQRYDLIYDLVGNHSFSERRRILNPNGICVMAGLGGAGWHEGFASRLLGELNGYLRSRFTRQKFIAYIAQFNKADMSIL